MNLPSFLWLWKIAAWSMGFAIFLYLCLAISGVSFVVLQRKKKKRPQWLRPFHQWLGFGMVFLIFLLLFIGLIGTVGYYGSLGHSIHLLAGIIIVIISSLSAWSSTQINFQNSWAKKLHVSLNVGLFFAFASVGLSGWTIVQKYLP